MTFDAFLERKRQLGGQYGFEPLDIPDYLFPFQREIVLWATRMGRAAMFADCGLGKTPMQLVWAENVIKHSSGRVLIVCPLAVSHQTIREAQKFGLEVVRSIDGTPQGSLTITNYERLHLFNPADYAGTVCDESSAIKSFDGKRRTIVTAFMRKQKYRLLATATAAPNDYTELGTSSEALGEMGLMDMLNKYFKNDQNNSAKGRMHGQAVKWRFRGHAEGNFWRWVASWARAVRKPSDIGYSDDGFVLPELIEIEHIVKANRPAQGMLFELPAVGLDEEREEQRRTLNERCEQVAALVNDTGMPAVVWCNLNDEGKRLRKLIPGAVEVAGSDTDDHKEQAFIDFAAGNIRVLITKPKIGGWGLNWQHCAHMTYFPTHSYEAYYQAVRRAWRFGQTQPVQVDIVTTEGGHNVMQSLKRKELAASRMFDELVKHMNDAISVDSTRYFTQPMEVPTWLYKSN